MRIINIKPNAVILTFALLFGCGQEYLEQKPITAYSPEGYYNTQASAEQGLYGVYDMLQKDGTYNRYMWSIVDSRSDDLNESSGDSYLNLANYTDNPATIAHNDAWSHHFQGVTRANSLLEGLAEASNATIPDDVKARIQAETKFLRAFFYFNLVNIFGGVPIVTKSLTPKEGSSVKRNTIEEVYAQIEADCEEAVAGLPLSKEIPTIETGRASKGSAQMLLARAYLFQQKYDKAAEVAKQIIDSKQYTLRDGALGYRTNFLVSGENGPECIFAVQYSNVNANNGWAKEEGNVSANWIRPGAAGGWSGNMINPSLIKQNPDKPLPLQGFEPNDPRRQYTITVPGTVLPLDDNPTFVVDAKKFEEKTSAKHWSSKWINGYNEVVDWTIYRYAETLLIRAEALIELNQGLDEAANLIKQVRDRVGLPDITTGKGQAELRDILRHERRVELAFELTRFWDLRRWNLLEVALPAAGKNFSPKFKYAPIPQNQIDLSNKALEQNEGW